MGENMGEIKWLSWINGIEYKEIPCPFLNNESIITYRPKDIICYNVYSAPFVEGGKIYYYRYDPLDDSWGYGWSQGKQLYGFYTEDTICEFGKAW